MSRAIRRHHEERLKRRWRGIILARWGDAYWRWGERALQRAVGISTTTAKLCRCCTVRYNRTEQRRIDREETDMTSRL